MKKTLAIMFLLFLLSLPLLVSARAPTPPVVSTLGPVVVCSDGDNINISSPQNGSYTSNRITLDFCVAVGGMFGQFGNVGYSVDGGTVYSVNSFINKTVDEHPSDAPDWYYYKTTAFATVALPKLSDGIHTIAVYYGWQYLGIPENPSLERFEVFAYENVSFTVFTVSSGILASDTATDSPAASPNSKPTIPEIPQAITVTVLLMMTLAAVALKMKFGDKISNQHYC